MKNKYNFILALYRNPLRPGRFQFAMKQGDWVYSTNSFICIRIPANKITEEDLVENPDIEFDKIFKKVEGIPESEITMPTDKLLGILSEYDLFIDRNNKCSNCDGDGNEECGECGHDKECDDCNGSGRSGPSDGVLKSLKFASKWITLNDLTFNPEYLFTVALTALTIGSQNIHFKIYKEKLTGFITFDESDLEVVLMARY